MSKLFIGFWTILFFVQGISGCRYWCRKPLSFEYTCCDIVNPVFTSTTVPSPAVPTAVTTTVTTQSTKELDQQSARKPCRYYCVYGDQVYCCDDGSSPMPADHNTHNGRCPMKKEQVCKKGGIFLHTHASKLTTKTGEKVLSKRPRSEEHPDCASDGYCLEDEKCCENICAKKHTCLKAVYDYDGTSKEVQKKKKRKN